jgi:hypothetical protein
MSDTVSVSLASGSEAPTHGEAVEIVEVIELVEIVDVEEFGRSNRKPPRAKRYRIRIDKHHYVVEVSYMTGRELLVLAGRTPPERWTISQKFHGGHTKPIGLDDVVDFTTHGVERFMTLPLDQNEG